MTGEELGLFWKVGGIVFACGVIYGELKAIRKDIARLETKQDKYNHLQERVLKLETWSDIHDKECTCRSSERRV